MRITFLGNFSVPYTSETHHANSLEGLGHQVVRLQERAVRGEQVYAEALQSDLFVWVHTHDWFTVGLPMERVLQELKAKNKVTMTYHLDLWLGLKRQKDLDNELFYKEFGHFFTVDKLMADWFNQHTRVQGHYLPAGVYDKECKLDLNAPKKYDIIFVGQKQYHPEWPYRPQLVDWLEQTYGDKFTRFGGELGTVRGQDLTDLYNSATVVIGDSLNPHFSYPFYWSDRIYETTGRGGFIIHPKIEGLEAQFADRKEVVYYDYGDFEQLRGLIDFYLQNDKPREMIRERGYRRTIRDHTYTRRWETILKELGL